jgi:hypothetical protein
MASGEMDKMLSILTSDGRYENLACRIRSLLLLAPAMKSIAPMKKWLIS